jgi:hypothetical protein
MPLLTVIKKVGAGGWAHGTTLHSDFRFNTLKNIPCRSWLGSIEGFFHCLVKHIPVLKSTSPNQTSH